MRRRHLSTCCVTWPRSKMQTQRSTLRSNLHAGDQRGLGEKRRGHVRPSPLLFSLESRSSPSRFSIIPADRLNPTRILVMKMDLFDIKLRLEVSRSHSASQSRSQPTILSAISGQELSVIFFISSTNNRKNCQFYG